MYTDIIHKPGVSQGISRAPYVREMALYYSRPIHDILLDILMDHWLTTRV
jgi:hypothetical protein